MRTPRFVGFIITVIALVLICCVSVFGRKTCSTGFLTGEPGGTGLRFDDHDLTIRGWDKDGITYFFIPSYISLESISQERAAYRIYKGDGQLLTSPDFSGVQDVLVEFNGEEMPWKVAFFASDNLYTAYIDLQGADVEDLKHDQYLPAVMRVIDPYGSTEIGEEKIQIKGRGNSTWEAEKKPFEVKSEHAVSICGMEPGKKWSFLANYYDDTKIINKLAFDLSGKMGLEYTIQSDWADIYINDMYYGNYLICKEPSLENNLLGISDLEKLNEPYFLDQAYDDGEIKGYDYKTQFENISGGYLIEKNWEESYGLKKAGFHSGDSCFTLKSPDNASLDEVRYIQSFINDKNDRIHEGDISGLDIHSFCTRFLIDEFLYNIDSARTSYFFYKKQNDNILYAGPCWDYDLACGRARESSFNDYTGTLLDQELEWVLDWDSKLMRNSLYKSSAARIFYDNKALMRSTNMRDVDEYHEKIRDSLAMDQIRWIGDNTTPARGYYEDQDNKFRYIKFFLDKRMSHLADLLDCKVDISGEGFTSKEMHSLTFRYEDGKEEVWEVKDGAQIDSKDLPEFDHSAFIGWHYQGSLEPFSYYVPIFEDMTIVLMSSEDYNEDES